MGPEVREARAVYGERCGRMSWKGAESVLHNTSFEHGEGSPERIADVPRLAVREWPWPSP